MKPSYAALSNKNKSLKEEKTMEHPVIVKSDHRYFKRTVLVLALTAGMLILFCSSSFARSSNGAYSFRDNYCFPYDNLTICYTNNVMVNQTSTPSGNVTFVGNGSTSYTETDTSGNIFYSDTLKYHTEGLTMDNVLTQYGTWFTTNLIIPGVSCTTKYAFHFADNQIQFTRTTSCQ